MKKLSKTYDVVVIGGGLSGMCAAISSARHGAKTALVHNRPVLGGNASSEIRMHICGADRHADRANARETGILEEILLLNKSRNDKNNYSWPVFDSCMWEKCRFQKNLDLYLNTNFDDVLMNGNKIQTVFATGLNNETKYTFTADYFIDATGDGMLGALSGAEYMYGREDKTAFLEKDALDTADNYTMGNSIMFYAVDTGKPYKFVKPDWAYTYTEEDMNHRPHNNVNSGYWWIELGGKSLHTIYDAEELRDELTKTVYGIWDHIKNGGDHGAENYKLEWVGALPGKRESRRLVGDYILREEDLLNATPFDDAVAYGGWSMDCHVIEGFLSSENEPTRYIHFDDVYPIPYRSLYSKNIENLFLGGRAISASHLAFASTRVMGTTSVCGQAVGTAAALAKEKGLTPRELGKHITELQQMLLKDDCYIPNFKNEDKNDFAKEAKITASSQKQGFTVENTVNGVARTVGDNSNLFCSNGISKDGETVTLDFGKKVNLKELHIKFDSNLSREIEISMDNWVVSRQEEHLPSTLVKDYDITLYNGGKAVKTISFTDNIYRFNRILLENTECDSIKITCYNTYGDEDIRIFEIRAY
ncbi:MAG: FAD-dependent oxidoreductase [Acutalibacteraceae bacterium]